MSETKPQNFANHGRFDPWYHFFLAPIALIIFIASIVHLVRHPHPWGIVHVIVAFALVVFVVKLRTYPLKVQDGMIRLEERVRIRGVYLPNRCVAASERILDDSPTGRR